MSIDAGKLFKENKVVIATAVTVIVLMGGTVAVEMPSDKKIAQLETQLAMDFQERKDWYQKQRQYHLVQELQAIRWRMNYLANEINRLNSIPHYLNRPMTPQEQWQVETAKEEWNLLKQRESELNMGTR